MAEEVFNDMPEEMHATIVPDANDSNMTCEESFESRETEVKMVVERNVLVSKTTATSALSALPTENGVSFAKILSFAGSCSINLLLPFVNGLMLGFGELVAHEISWDWNWFKKSNKGYRIFPESRKMEASGTLGDSGSETEGGDKFL